MAFEIEDAVNTAAVAVGFAKVRLNFSYNAIGGAVGGSKF